MKRLTPISISLYFQRFKLISSGHVFHVLLTNAHSLLYNRIDCFAFFIKTYINAAILL